MQASKQASTDGLKAISCPILSFIRSFCVLTQGPRVGILPQRSCLLKISQAADVCLCHIHDIFCHTCLWCASSTEKNPFVCSFFNVLKKVSQFYGIFPYHFFFGRFPVQINGSLCCVCSSVSFRPFVFNFLPFLGFPKSACLRRQWLLMGPPDHPLAVVRALHVSGLPATSSQFT